MTEQYMGDLVAAVTGHYPAPADDEDRKPR